MFKTLSRRSCLSLLLSAPLVAAASGPLRASDDARRAAVLERQRRLGARIGMAAFTAGAEVDADLHLELMEEAAAAFEVGLGELDAAEVDAVWSRYAEALAKIGGPRDLRKSTLNALAGLDDELSAALAALATEAPRGPARAVALALRQAGRAQEMARDAALIAVGQRRTEAHAQLQDTRPAFDADLLTLLAGDAEARIPAPPPAAEAKLLEAQAIWVEFGAIVRDVASAGRTTTFDLEALAEDRDPLSDAFAAAASLYELA
ncbi:MAG: hypothetical protein AAGF90_18540 [Pseudomonadota bacterium]